MKRRAFFLTFILCSFLFVDSAFASSEVCDPEFPCPEESVETSGVEPKFHGEKVCVYYFYGAGCSACAKTTPFIEGLARTYGEDVELKKLEIYYDQEMRELFYDFVRRYGGERKEAGVPAVFLGSTYLSGSGVIKKNLEQKLVYFIENKPEICPLKYKKMAGAVEKPRKLTLTLPAVILAGAVDSVNPCALSVLIFLLVYLFALRSRRRILKVGLTYTFSVFLVYFLAGVGLLRLIQFTKISQIIAYVGGAVAMAAGLVNVKDFFWPGKGPSLKIPESKKPVLERWIKRASVPAAMVLGFLVSAFELPCTGGVYLAILSLLAKNPGVSSLGYLLLYNFIFVLPLAIIVFLAYFGIEPERLEALRKEHRRTIRLVMGLVMLGLGVVLLA